MLSASVADLEGWAGGADFSAWVETGFLACVGAAGASPENPEQAVRTSKTTIDSIFLVVCMLTSVLQIHRWRLTGSNLEGVLVIVGDEDDF
jgi:hypothetical protein